MKRTMKGVALAGVLLAFGSAALAQDQPGALAPANLNKTRPKAPFDITGTWQHAMGPNNPFQFAPPPGFKLTPTAQVQYDAAQKARKEGKAYHDDIGQCWPAGLPVIMTRVWPIAMVQKPTAIYMISAFLNAVRIVYLDGRPHTDPDVIVRTFNGESIGHYEGETLVVDTTGFVNDHHWIDNGVPVTDALHIVERMRLIEGGKTLEIETTASDPKSWEGEWKWTKRFKRMDDTDITEAECLPNVNDHLPSTRSNLNVR